VRARGEIPRGYSARAAVLKTRRPSGYPSIPADLLLRSEWREVP